MTPPTCPRCAELCEEHNVGAVVPLTDLDIEVLAHGRAAGRLPAFVPDPEIARATFDKYEAHLLLERLGLPSPPTVLPGEPPAGFPVMVKPRQGSGARSIHRADDPARRRVLRRLRAGADDDPADDGRSRILDRLPLRSSRALPERDSAHDDRVARRGVDQGHGDRRPRAGRSRPPRREALGRAGPVHRPGVPRPGDRPGDHRRQHPLRRRVSGPDVRRAAGPYLSRADRADGARRRGRAACRRFPGRGHVHPVLLAARAR